MADGEYSQKEENTFRETLKTTLNNQDDILKKIYEQTLKTNGRVSRHDWYFQILWWGLGLIGSALVFIGAKLIEKII